MTERRGIFALFRKGFRDLRAKELTMRSLICLVLTLALTAGQFVVALAQGEEEETDDNLYVYVKAHYDKAADVISRINSERRSHGVSALTTDQTLMDAALVRAAENILYFEHARPNGRKWDSVSSKVMGENLGRGTSSTSEIMRLWMNSPGHMENIIRSSFRSVGVACIESGGTYYWVQLFGTSGGSGADIPDNGRVPAALDLPTAEEGGSYLLDYRITAAGGGKLIEAESNAEVYEIENGASLQLGLLGDNLEFDPSKLTWIISNPEIAEIDENGVLTVTGMGTARIKAASGSRERAAIEIDTRANIGDMYILGKLPFISVMAPEGFLVEGRDYMMRRIDSDGDGSLETAEIRGADRFKGMVTVD